MSTRACYVFKENDGGSDVAFTVYKHYDGYPSGASEFLVNALTKAWPLPRYEADDFAAAFVAANKEGGGNVRLTHAWHNNYDIEYVYVIEQADNGQLIISAHDKFNCDRRKLGKPFFYGRLKDFIAEHCEINAVISLWNEYVPSDNPLLLK